MTAQEIQPDRLGPYRLTERLGEGGMGVVYRGVDAAGRTVAVKALRPAVAGDTGARRRLAREVETMRRVRSPFVAEVIDADISSEPPYIVTRYVSGQTLEKVVGAGSPLAGQALARLAAGLASALASVHAAGVVHRDLKPGNVMLTGGDPVVIDFGIAQLPDATRLTMTGMFMGTPGYLAPEVIEGKQTGPAADVHSWGATVAFAATGRAPFGGGSFETIFYRIVHGQPDLGGCPGPLLPLVASALARDPARRPTAAELEQRLAGLVPSSLVPAASQPDAGQTAGGHDTVTDIPAPGTRQFPSAAAGTGMADDIAGMLPPVDYQLPGGPAGALPGAAPGYPPAAAGQRRQPRRATGSPRLARGRRTAASAGRSRASALLAAAMVVVAVCVTVAAPVIGGAAALAGLLLLRAGEATGGRLRRRRSGRGARPADALLAAVLLPLALAWSVTRSVLLLPLGLGSAAAVAAITIIAMPVHPLPHAFAYAAGTLVAFYGLGPASGAARRPLRALGGVVAGSAIGAVIAFAGLAALAVVVISFAAVHPPAFWPLGHLTARLHHLPGLHGLISDARTQLVRLAARFPV